MIFSAAMVGVAGCRQYTPQPLDDAAHRAEWAARGPESPAVRDFIENLHKLTRQTESPAPPDVTDGLSLDEAEVVALVFNPDLAVQHAEVNEAAQNAAHAGLWDDPVFSLDLLRIVESVPEPWILGTSLEFGIPISGRLGAEKRVASAQHLTALAGSNVAAVDLTAQLREAWLRWSALQWRSRITNELIDDLQRMVSSIDRLEQAGEITRPQARLFRLEHQSQLLEQSTLRAQIEDLEGQIKSILGLMPEAPVQMQQTLSIEARSLPLDEQASLADLLARFNPTLSVRQWEYDAAEATLEREIRAQFPDLGLGPAYSYEDGDNRVGGVLSLPIPLWNRNQRAIAVAEAQRETARLRYEAEVERQVSQAARVQRQIALLEERRGQIESVLGPMADEQLADARRLAELGEFDPLLLLESLVRTQEVKGQLIDATLELGLARTRWNALLGDTLFTRQKLFPPFQSPEEGNGP